MNIKNYTLFFFTVFTLLTSCSKEEVFLEKNFPTIITNNITDIESTSAMCHGEVLTDGGSNITERGICWSNNPTPDLNDNKVVSGTGLGSFKTTITDLILGTKYYVRAYATNSVGTSYGEEIEFTTLRKHLMFTKDIIWKHALQNSMDKLLYFFTQEKTNSSGPFTIVAYNYSLNEISAEKEIGSYGINFMPLHSLGIYNGQMELYIIYENTVQILNAITLEEITSFEVTGVNALSSIRQENNLLFIGCWDSENNNLLVYSRESLTQISQGIYTVNGRAITTYYDSPTDKIFCISFPQYSNSNIFVVDVFDNSGNFSSSSLDQELSGNNLIRTNDNAAFVIKGKEGHLYYKSHFSVFGTDADSKISTSGSLVDYQISSDGNTVYTIQNDYTIKLYNSTDFTSYESIEIEEKGRHLFIDGDDILIIDYSAYSFENTEVYLLKY